MSVVAVVIVLFPEWKCLKVSRLNSGSHFSRMILLKRYCLLTHNFDSLYQSPMLNIVRQPQKSSFSRLTSSADKFVNGSNTDEKDRHIKLIKLEISLIHERGGDAPDVNSITKHQWDELLILNSKKARNKYYKRLFSREQANVSGLHRQSLH